MKNIEKESLIHSMGMKYDEAAELFSDETLSSMAMSYVVGAGTNNGCNQNGCGNSDTNNGCTQNGCGTGGSTSGGSTSGGTTSSGTTTTTGGTNNGSQTAIGCNATLSVQFVC